MSIPNVAKLKLMVLQQLKRKGTYGHRTYRSISDSTGIKYATVKYLVKQLIAEGRVNIAELKPENGETLEENSSNIPPERREQSRNEESSIHNKAKSKQENIRDIDIDIKTIKDYIRKMLKGRAQKNEVITASYINYCRQNLNTKNLTLEDFEMLGQLISSNVNLMTAENIKLGILGFIRANKIHLAKKFYQDCSLEVLKHLQIALCTKEELNEIEKDLDDYEQKLQIYAKLRQGYPVEIILEETNVSENVVRRIASSVEKEKQARQNKEREGMEH